MEAIVPRDFDNPSPDAVLSLVSFGTWCSLILTGQSAQEAYTYFRRYPKDGYDLKALFGQRTPRELDDTCQVGSHFVQRRRDLIELIVHTSVVLTAVNSRRSLVDRGSEGIELRSFDLDVSPQPGSCSTIEWADAERLGDCSTSRLVMDGSRSDDPTLLPWTSTATLRMCFYSTAPDVVIPSNVVEEHAAEARRFGFLGQMVTFGKIAHVSHARDYPEKYWDTVLSAEVLVGCGGAVRE
ncbi:hypothetical protein LXA43DRAFT_1094644 [Ganoderma leucocontextum]|nr:hypothetical protein LXA43DRAFT_1094644 [Ganoderma leucocontextum]